MAEPVLLTGGCYCGKLRFEAEPEIRMRGLCLCRTCQKISGGAGNLFIGLQAKDFRYVSGRPARFTLGGVADAPTREFCADCGVHIAARSPKAPGGLILKVGTLDDPAIFRGPELVVWTDDKHDFHLVPEDVAAYPRFPGR
jgi:hypothetical protein